MEDVHDILNCNYNKPTRNISYGVTLAYAMYGTVDITTYDNSENIAVSARSQKIFFFIADQPTSCSPVPSYT